MGEVVQIRSTEEALSLAKDWHAEADRWEIRAMQMELLYLTYKLRFRRAEAEIARLASLVE